MNCELYRIRIINTVLNFITIYDSAEMGNLLENQYLLYLQYNKRDSNLLMWQDIIKRIK